MDNFLSSVTHRPSLSYPLTSIAANTEQVGHAHASYFGRPQYFQRVSNWGSAGYHMFPRRKPGPWMTKFFRPRKNDIPTLCTGSCLPCVLYGRTQYRLKQMAEGEDPLDMSRHDTCNGPCWMYGMIMCCVGFDWFIVMLQHSRVRATYNIDGTAGGDCVQSLFCSRCTLLQDEWEVIAREEKILSEREEMEINRQPTLQQQMRYSTSNLLGEVPEVFRPATPNAQQVTTPPQFSSPQSCRALETEVVDPLLSDISNQKHSRSSMKGVASKNKPRQSSYWHRKLVVRKLSPIGSALNPITIRNNTVDRREPTTGSSLSQRSVTNLTRLNDSPTPLGRHPSSNLIRWESKDKAIEAVSEQQPPTFVALKGEDRRKDFNSSIRSDVGIRSLALDSLPSRGSTGDEIHGDAKADESVIVYYGCEDKPQCHRLSDFPHSRPSTPEFYNTQQTTLDNSLANGAESSENIHITEVHAKCDGNSDTIDTGKTWVANEYDIGHTEKYGDKAHAEKSLDEMSTTKQASRCLSLAARARVSSNLAQLTTMGDINNIEDNAPLPYLAIESEHQDRRHRARSRSLTVPTESPKCYPIDIDKFENVLTVWFPKDFSTEDPRIGSSKTVKSRAITGGSQIDNASTYGTYIMAETLQESDFCLATSVIKPTSACEGTPQYGEPSAIQSTEFSTNSFGCITEDWVEVRNSEIIPTSPGQANPTSSEQSAHDHDLLSDDCEFISAEQRISDECADEYSRTLLIEHPSGLVNDETGEFQVVRGGANSNLSSHDSKSDSTGAELQQNLVPDINVNPVTVASSLDNTPKYPVSIPAKDIAPEDSELGSTSRPTVRVKNSRVRRPGSKRARNRRERKRRATAEEVKTKL